MGTPPQMDVRGAGTENVFQRVLMQGSNSISAYSDEHAKNSALAYRAWGRGDSLLFSEQTRDLVASGGITPLHPQSRVLLRSGEAPGT